MAELNDKLISYGNLSTFYDKLQEQGLGGNAIEDASILPDASENKSKLIRLSSDDNVYVSELKSRTSTTTNRLPDEQQIDKAFLCEDGIVNYYKGSYKIIFSDTEVDGYGWLYDEDGEWGIVLTVVDAEHITSGVDFYSVAYDDEGASIDRVNKIVQVDIEASHHHFSFSFITATYNAPESGCICNAYLNVGNNIYYYTGEATTIEFEGDNIQVYRWDYIDNGTIYSVYSEKQANEIYGYIDNYHLLYSYVTFYYPQTGGNEIINGNEEYPIYGFYIPQLNAPDSEQINNAYINCNDGNEFFPDTIYNYTGVRKTLVVSDGSLYAYLWGKDTTGTPGIWGYATTVPANEIYGKEKVCLAALDNYSWTESSDDTITNLEISLTDLEENNIIPIGEDGETVSTVKYQRTEVTEEWDWQPLTDNATNDDIDAMFNSESPVVKRVLMKENNRGYDMTIKEGLVNVSGETMEYEGQTYYKWVKYEDRENGTSTPDEVGDENVIVLTTSLNPTLPFSSSSPEWAYMIGSESEEAVYASPSTETYPKEALIHEDGSITYEE